MDTRSLGMGLILFGILAIGGTVDGARRKIAAQPDWVAMNWKSYVKGLAGWLVVGALALLGGIVMALV
ncbi:hypothetical protein KRR38_17560 [Novosphingobium sp. G106]|uniref:hypothetical protein n=1 Tax=Novosphingobium sp. G106 TaxID=2849500 RepID=UPI001C2CF664|nr:hypothetical protein [Novosphingobium sp. G106]MBV1689431.1 hypothetical protein [Novosphingobium sp. G106]